VVTNPSNRLDGGRAPCRPKLVLPAHLMGISAETPPSTSRSGLLYRPLLHSHSIMPSQLTSEDFTKIREFAVSVARQAGALILEGSEAIQSVSSQETGVNEKKNSVDLVTAYDVRVEELVQSKLKERYPDFKLYVRTPLRCGWCNLMRPFSQHRRGIILHRKTGPID
jgi:Inositol monophosphatase family